MSGPGVRRRAAQRDGHERLIVAAARKMGASVHHISEAGLPDLLVGHRGRTLLVEVKRPGSGLNQRQQAFLNAWTGGPVYVVKSEAEMVRLLQ